MFLENVTLQLPSLSAEEFEEGIVSLLDPEHSWAELWNFRHSLFSPHTPQNLAVIQMEGHKHIRNILEKSLISLFFPWDFLAVGQRWGWTDFVTWSKPLMFPWYPFKTSNRDPGSVDEDSYINFHSVPWAIPLYPSWSEGRGWDIFPRSIFCFAPCFLQFLRGEFCTGNSFYSPFIPLKMTLESRKCKLRGRKGAGWGSSLCQMLLR